MHTLNIHFRLLCGLLKDELNGKPEERTEANPDFTINLINQTDFSNEKIALLVGEDEAWGAEIRKQNEK